MSRESLLRSARTQMEMVERDLGRKRDLLASTMEELAQSLTTSARKVREERLKGLSTGEFTRSAIAIDLVLQEVKGLQDEGERLGVLYDAIKEMSE